MDFVGIDDFGQSKPNELDLNNFHMFTYVVIVSI